MLARQVLTSSVAVTLPGTLLLGGVTLYLLAVLGSVDRQLAEITRSLEATRELHLAVSRAESRLRAFLLGGDSRTRAEFDQWIVVAETQLASCASAPCHGASRTPREMAALLSPAVERLKRDGRSILEGRRGDGGAARAAVETVDPLIAGIDRELDRMASGLIRRVEDSGRRVDSARRWASLLTALLTVAIVLTAGGVAVAVARRIVRPVRELLVGTRRIIAGDWRYRVLVGRSGEVAELASSFNTMMAELCDYRERLEEYNRTLEQRVDERSNELRRIERVLEQSERLAAVGRLAADVAHQLNNPLTSLVMNAGLLMEEAGADSPLGAHLRRITGDAYRCSHLIDELRLFASPSVLHTAPSSVHAVVERALSLAGRELAARGVRVKLDLDPDVPEVVWDAEQILHVLVSLCMNAAEAMPDGGLLRVHVRHVAEWLTIEIRDTGSGIRAEHHPRIFDPFFTTRPDRSGLGLSISSRIVHDHGGHMEVHSRTRDESREIDEAGTTVRIVLPIAAAPDADEMRESGCGQVEEFDGCA